MDYWIFIILFFFLPSMCELCAVVKQWDVFSFWGRWQTDYGVEAGYVSIIFLSSHLFLEAFLLVFIIVTFPTLALKSPESWLHKEQEAHVGHEQLGPDQGVSRPLTCLVTCSAAPTSTAGFSLEKEGQIDPFQCWHWELRLFYSSNEIFQRTKWLKVKALWWNLGQGIQRPPLKACILYQQCTNHLLETFSLLLGSLSA